jgi:hypothetical protein
VGRVDVSADGEVVDVEGDGVGVVAMVGVVKEDEDEPMEDAVDMIEVGIVITTEIDDVVDSFSGIAVGIALEPPNSDDNRLEINVNLEIELVVGTMTGLKVELDDNDDDETGEA